MQSLLMLSVAVYIVITEL